MARLSDTTIVVNPDTGAAEVLAAGDEVPSWAKDQVGDHLTENSSDGPPPKAGRGSGTEAWATYATANDVIVEDDAGRDDIIAACEAAGVPTE